MTISKFASQLYFLKKHTNFQVSSFNPPKQPTNEHKWGNALHDLPPSLESNECFGISRCFYLLTSGGLGTAWSPPSSKGREPAVEPWSLEYRDQRKPWHLTSNHVNVDQCALDLCLRKTTEKHLKSKRLAFLEIPEKIKTVQEMC